jgi:hypothetical protein
VLLSYCDDTAYFASLNEVRQQFEAAMCKRFDCKLLGQLHWFLQAHVTQQENFDVTIHQSRYASSLCTRFLPGFDVLKPSAKDMVKYAAPLPYGFIFTKDDYSKDYFELKKLEDEFQLEYPVVIGCLLWILNTFPRLQFPIRKLAKYMRQTSRQHFWALQFLLHHVRPCQICFHRPSCR